MIGIADTPGNAMDPWVSAAGVALASRRTRIALCVTNLLTRHPAVSAAAVASHRCAGATPGSKRINRHA
jgi:alkanesulfonate monooxygenase SsuD/methylene tetrahydromethanopterin reductase-like flavin-dependent oxidoreductase (luciferase family)